MKYFAPAIAGLTAGAGVANALSVSGLVAGFSGAVSDLWNGEVQLPLGASSEQRLLQLSETEQIWATEDEMLQLKRQGKTFFDVTDHIEFYNLVQEASSSNVAQINSVLGQASESGASSDVAVAAANAALRINSTVEFPSEVGYRKEVKKLSEQLNKDNLKSNLVEFSSFHTRYAKSEHGLNSSLWLFDHVKEIADKSAYKATVTLFDHSWLQKSVIARIPGTKNPDKVVVVGAHQDSINLLFPSLLAAPGADDDGSGTVTILEVFRVLTEAGFEPENTLEFQWYSAEELGLWGSQDIFNSYSKKEVDVVAMLQQDMTGYSAGTTADGSPDSLGLITDFVDEGLTDFIRLVVEEYCDIGYVETKCGYACSDHASAAKVGYPSAFVIESAFSSSDHYLHTTRDTVDVLDFDHMHQHAKLTLGFAYELARAEF
ncbi:putative aminopeptidase [Sugiyamaella lignohabitans]|uniref:Peptide hydrolase n=1 Tax=Sugiyamaella lignohabitans TaxID=796027 RepID=A0A167FPK8_9ASCO|nr:putative aminopeptidase [Sugiyamaella lignohabitans]ANB15543.1 putative aminopeptidase [Sugiyamaella lignohabitans]